MSNFVFNIAKGRVAHYGTLPGTNDGFVVVPISTAGLIEPDVTLVKHLTLESILTVADAYGAKYWIESTLGRKTLTGVNTVVDHNTNESKVVADDFLYADASGTPVRMLFICYVPDLSTSSDAEYIPLLKFDFSAIPNGKDIPVQFGSSGLYLATYPEDRNY